MHYFVAGQQGGRSPSTQPTRIKLSVSTTRSIRDLSPAFERERGKREMPNIRIPVEWLDARAFLQKELDDRDTRLEILSVRVTAMADELHVVRDGVRHLNESFRGVQEQNALMVQMMGTSSLDQIENWKTYTIEQSKQTELLEKGHKLLLRDDVTRTPMRLVTILILLAILFMQVVEKAL